MARCRIAAALGGSAAARRADAPPPVRPAPGLQSRGHVCDRRRHRVARSPADVHAHPRRRDARRLLPDRRCRGRCALGHPAAGGAAQPARDLPAVRTHLDGRGVAALQRRRLRDQGGLQQRRLLLGRSRCGDDRRPAVRAGRHRHRQRDHQQPADGGARRRWPGPVLHRQRALPALADSPDGATGPGTTLAQAGTALHRWRPHWPRRRGPCSATS